MKLRTINRPENVATIAKPDSSNGKNYGGDKRMLSQTSVLAIVEGEITEVVDFRVYCAKGSRTSRNYVSLWAHGNGFHLAGHGWAGGYGYHRPSAALSSAFSSAGVKLSADIDGRGEGVMEHAACALARTMGYTGDLFISSHGS